MNKINKLSSNNWTALVSDRPRSLTFNAHLCTCTNITTTA